MKVVNIAGYFISCEMELEGNPLKEKPMNEYRLYLKNKLTEAGTMVHIEHSAHSWEEKLNLWFSSLKLCAGFF